MRFIFTGLVILLIGLLQLAHATTIATPELSSVEAVSSAFQFYSTEHNGTFPTNWQQIGEILDLNHVNYSLRDRQSYPLEDHYQFITQSLSVPDEEGSQVLLIRTIPLAHQNDSASSDPDKWRYLIYKRKSGEIFCITMQEQKVQAMLTKAGVTITPKAGLPVVEDDERKMPLPQRLLKPNPIELQHEPIHSNNAPTDTPPSLQSGKPVTFINDQRIPPWIYVVIVLSVILIGAVWVSYTAKIIRSKIVRRKEGDRHL